MKSIKEYIVNKRITTFNNGDLKVYKSNVTKIHYVLVDSVTKWKKFVANSTHLQNISSASIDSYGRYIETHGQILIAPEITCDHEALIWEAYNDEKAHLYTMVESIDYNDFGVEYWKNNGWYKYNNINRL